MTVEELFNIKDPDKQIATDGINEYTILTSIELSLYPIVKHHYIYIFTNTKTLEYIDFKFIQTKDQKPYFVNWRDESILSKFSLIKKETKMKTTFKQDEAPIQQIKFPAFMRSQYSDLIVLFFDETSGVVVKSNSCKVNDFANNFNINLFIPAPNCEVTFSNKE